MSRVFLGALALLSLLAARPADAKPQIAIAKIEGALKATVAQAIEKGVKDRAKVFPLEDWEAAAIRVGAAPNDPTAIAKTGAALGVSSAVYVKSGREGRKWQVTVEIIDVKAQAIVKRWKVRSKKISRVSYLVGKLFWSKAGSTITRLHEASGAVAEAPVETPPPVEAPPPPVEAPPPPVAVTPPPPPVVAAPPPAAPSTPTKFVVLKATGRSRRYATKAITEFGAKSDAYDEMPLQTARDEAARLDVDLDTADGRVEFAATMGVTAWLEADARYSKRRYRTTLKVYDGRSGEVLDTVALVARSRSGMARAIEQALERLLGQTAVPRLAAPPPPPPVVVAPPPSPPPSPAVASTPSGLGASEPSAATKAETEAPDAPREPATMSTSPVVARLDFRLFSRSLAYNDDIFGELRPYEVIGAPAIGGAVTWFIPAMFTDAWYQHIGLDLSGQYGVALSSENAAGQVFDTSALTVDVGAYGRLPLGRHEIGLLVGMGIDDFTIQDTPDGASAQVPGVTYVTARFGGRVRFFITDEISVRAEGAYRLVLGAGEIRDDAWFPRASVGAADAQLGVSYDLGLGFYADAGFAMRRFFYTFNPEPGDPWIVGGAADQYFAGNVSIGWYLP